ncbi:hypothetical protein CTA2_2405 [Colletotrichum tanaceti]|uniref:Rhodopsin domain-containing protein n=1 Tax=Colletotrichum tanaceti TaxID=1306861 RepID=A0A4V6DIG4_9PEZI|nr:hypothetical protein CTA2_2405 [Colletotrichum tanaceti]TKW60276.1 hypothetical protein CTA1_4734 [Colletotrichum tanaceti]
MVTNPFALYCTVFATFRPPQTIGHFLLFGLLATPGNTSMPTRSIPSWAGLNSDEQPHGSDRCGGAASRGNARLRQPVRRRPRTPPGVHVCFIQTTVVVFLAIRVYVKLLANEKFRLEDWSCLVGWIFTVMLNTPVFLMLHFGEGFRVREITAKDGHPSSSYQIDRLQWLYIGSLFYSPAAFFTKAAILLLTVRVFSVNKIVARTLHGLLAFFLLCYIPKEVAKAVVCIPVPAFWDPSIHNFKCINQLNLFTYDSTLSIISDLIILVVPVVLTWKVKVSTFKKIRVIRLLGADGVAVAVTVCRLFLVIERLDDPKDPTVEFIPVDWTIMGELAIGVVCACVPSINYLHEQRTARTGSSTSSQRQIPWVEGSLQDTCPVFVNLRHGLPVQVGDWE